MDIKINELSAKTFNWLGMNESVVKDVPEFECGSMVVTTPDEVTCERELVDSIALSGIDKETSGMGRDIDELISDSGVNSFVLKTKPGITSSKPAIVKVPADAGTINKLVIETDKDSTITVVMDYLSDSLHDEEKNKIMNAFKENKIQILVSTTVIEVGVDVSNANMMVIYNAERFGLSQLHQLRGRVGRSKEQGYCYLLSEATHSEQKERLEFLENHHDGFEVSEYDLKIRGPGDLLGQKQSGLPTFMIGDIFKDYHILEITRKDAFEAMNQHQDDEKIIKLLSEIKNNLIKNNEYID